MLTNSPGNRHLPEQGTWQQQLAAAITDPAQLLARLQLDPALLDPAGLAGLQHGAQGFRLRVPESFVRRMRPGDPADPLLRQVLPLGLELARTPGFSSDPLAESSARLAPGLLQKYQGRALLITTGACAVHCRYCFRREYDYAADTAEADSGRWEAELTALAANPSIHEIILSGGDPLSLSNARLGSLLQRLQQLPHLRRVRLHTRTPIVLPARVDEGLLQLLRELRLQTVVVVHANHAAEIDAEVTGALQALRATGLTLLSQSVLLAGINDAAQTLAALSEALFAAGALPYYLFLLDRINGTAHFEVSRERARQLMQELNALLPGYLLPRLAQEEPGQPSKTHIDIGSVL